MILKTSALGHLYAFLSTRTSLLWSRPNDDPAEDQLPTNTFVREMITNLVESLDYRPPDSIKEVRATYQSLYSEFSAYNNFDDERFEKICQVAATMGELSYPDHPLEIQLQIARFSWFVLYIDDLGQTFRSSLEGFQQRVITNECPEGDFLQAYREHLTDMYKYWDTVPANFITIAAMEFINGYLLEEMPVFRDMKLSNMAQSWPYYMRAKTGGSTAYAYMIFPRELTPDASVYIQVIEDISLFTSFVNDIMSFYKEALAGETNNYVHSRAYVTQKSISDTLQDMFNDTLAAHARVTKVLQSTDALIPWKRYVNGYLAFHLSLQRYHLSDLGF